MKQLICVFCGGLLILGISACTQHKVEVAPVEIKPIHITIDVNVKVDKALEDYFHDVDAAESKTD
jgi:Skp family chaperone for outer membrane proteins